MDGLEFIGHNFTWMNRDPQDCGCDECQDQILREYLRECREAYRDPEIEIKSGRHVRCHFCQSSILSEQHRVEVTCSVDKSWPGGFTFRGFDTLISHINCYVGFEQLVDEDLYLSIQDVVRGYLE